MHLFKATSCLEVVAPGLIATYKLLLFLCRLGVQLHAERSCHVALDFAGLLSAVLGMSGFPGKEGLGALYYPCLSKAA